MERKTFNIVCDNTDNFYQRRDAAHAFAQLANQAFEGSFAYLVSTAISAHGFEPDVDRRTKVGKELELARDEMINAIGRYDLARKAAGQK